MPDKYCRARKEQVKYLNLFNNFNFTKNRGSAFRIDAQLEYL